MSSGSKSVKNIVLVHGAWADGSSWSGVIERLQADGFHVRAPQFPLSSLAEDVARLRQVLAFQDGPTLVVGHSYGGQVITALGADAPNVVGLVYIAAFGLDEGESLGELPPRALVRRSRTCSPMHAGSAGSQRTTSSIAARHRRDTGKSALRRPAAARNVCLRLRHGRPGVEVVAFLVPGRPER